MDEDLIVSGAFTVLRKKLESNYNTEVLKVILRTAYYRDWLLQCNVGTSYPVIKGENILKMPVPIISEETQNKIVGLVQKSLEMKKESNALIDSVIRCIEVAIEKNEIKAINYIKGIM